MKCISTVIILILLASCVSQLGNEDRTIYVANEYLVYQNQRFQEMQEILSLDKCDESVDLFISPLVNTDKDRFSDAVADFITMCGEPKVITIQVGDSTTQ